MNYSVQLPLGVLAQKAAFTRARTRILGGGRGGGRCGPAHMSSETLMSGRWEPHGRWDRYRVQFARSLCGTTQSARLNDKEESLSGTMLARP